MIEDRFQLSQLGILNELKDDQEEEEEEQQVDNQNILVEEVDVDRVNLKDKSKMKDLEYQNNNHYRQ